MIYIKKEKLEEIIKHQNEIIEDLKKENKLLKERIKELENVIVTDKFNFANPQLLTYKNELLKEKVNQLETNRDEAIEYIKRHFEEEYKKPREELKKYNLKNCTYDSGLVALYFLERGKE